MSDKAYKDVVFNDINGYLVNKNPKVFASKVIKLLRNDPFRKELAGNALKTAQKYSARQTALDLVAVYEEMLQAEIDERSSWKDVMSSLNAEFATLLQRNYRLSRITVNIREMDRIMNFLKNRFIR